MLKLTPLARRLIALLLLIAVIFVLWRGIAIRQELGYQLAIRGHLDAARFVYRTLANQGDPLGENNYAVLIDNNRYAATEESEKNRWYTLAYELYRDAAASGLEAARLNLGSMDRDQTRHAPEADQLWYKQAGEDGDAIAKLIYARNYPYKTSDPQYGERIALLRMLADSGDAEAEYRFGEAMYGKDEEVSDRYYRMAAEQGHFEATGRWATRLLQTGGETQEVVKWTTRAAEAGDIEAQEAMGELYRDGDRVPRDLAKAAYWFAMSADLSNAHEEWTRLYRLEPTGFRCCYWVGGAYYPNVRESAAYEAGVLYLSGNGVPKDLNKARHYLDLAATICWKDACDLLKQLPPAGAASGGG